MTDAETIALRATVIAGKRYDDDFTVIWRGLPIGRVMLAPGLPPHVPQWRWTCNFYGKPGGGGSGSGDDLDYCKRQFKVRHGQRCGGVRDGLWLGRSWDYSPS